MLKSGTPGAPQPNVHLGASKPTNKHDLPDTPEEREKQEWARQMRLKFVTDKKMIHEDGSLNLDYFKPKSGTVKIRKWGERERANLIKGIEKHGIGRWENIRNEFLPDWEPTELRTKTQRLMGRQSLVEYIQQNWRGNSNDVTVEYKRNKEIGMKLSHWKGGVLINDDQGVVKKTLAEYPYPPGYVNNTAAAAAAAGAQETATLSQEERQQHARYLTGRRVMVWFDNAKQYFGGLVTAYDEAKNTYAVQWDPDESGISQLTEVELAEKDRTTDPRNDERWCLERDLSNWEYAIKEEEEAASQDQSSVHVAEEEDVDIDIMDYDGPVGIITGGDVVVDGYVYGGDDDII